MNTDGNTYAINRHLAEREDHDRMQELLAAEARVPELEDRIKELEAEARKWQANHDTWMAIAKSTEAKLAEAERRGMERAINIANGCDRVCEVGPAIRTAMDDAR